MQVVKSYFMAGAWREKPLAASSVTIRNPYDGAEIFQYTEPTAAEVAEAVGDAYDTVMHRVLDPRERADILLRASELLEKRSEAMANTIVAETGKPIRDSRAEVARAVRNFRVASEEAARLHGFTEQQDPVGEDGVLSLTIREPLGVVCAITPFNFPLNVVALKIAPALAAGNAVVLKPADFTPLTAVRLTEIITEAGLPAGYLNVLLGTGLVGQALVQDPRIALYTFTGSVGVGKRIKEQSGLRPVILELGSNAPNIVHGDANLELAVEALVKASFAYAGQVCISAQRIYVHERVWDDFVERFTARVRTLSVGDPRDEATDIGPLIHEQAVVRVSSWIDEAVTGGATLLTGGRREGNALDPVVLVDVQPDMAVMRKEVFGPVVSIVRYRTVAEVIDYANDSDFGLQAAIFTNDLSVALALARGLRVGSVNVNQASNVRMDTMPYGGIKDSGIGKEGARASMEYMTTAKVITLRYGRPDLQGE